MHDNRVPSDPNSGPPKRRTGRPNFSCSIIRSPETLSNLIHKAGHEIGNPLTAVISLATIIERFGDKDSDKVAGYAGSIIQEAWKISALTERMVLMLSARRFPTVAADPIRAIKVSAERLLKQREYSMLDYRLKLPAVLPEAYIEPEQFRVAVTELIRNAFQAVLRDAESAGGSVEDAELPAIEVIAEADAQYIRITVRNPIDKPTALELDRLFDLFSTGFPERKLFGAGLTVAWAIVERFGGSIEVSEEPVDGKFSFSAIITLLRADRKPVKTEEGKQAAQVDPKQVSILLIEDEPAVASAMRKILKLAFKLNDSEISSAEGREAIKLFESGKSFDLIFCDMNLKDINGRQIFEAVSTANPSQARRFVFLTGDRISQDITSFLASNSLPVLYKPFEAEQLIQTAIEALKRD